MQQQQKAAIAKAAAAYLREHQISANDLAGRSGVNQSYLSQILNGKFSTKANDKDVEIAPKYFERIASSIGFAFKKAYWETIATTHFMETVSTLEACKQSGRVGMIIAPTGVGKSNAVDLFCRQNPRHTYRLTVSSVYRPIHMVNELCEIVGADVSTLQIGRSAVGINTYSMKLRLDKLADKLADIRHAGGCPIVIIDEAENMERASLKIMKGLYDAVKDRCAIVLIGTSDLLVKMSTSRARHQDGMPQLWRRFKAGCRHLSAFERERDFQPFFDRYVADKGLRKLLCQLADNYGELNDYLEPALREADARGEALSEDLFRIIYNLPKR